MIIFVWIIINIRGERVSYFSIVLSIRLSLLFRQSVQFTKTEKKKRRVPIVPRETNEFRSVKGLSTKSEIYESRAFMGIINESQRRKKKYLYIFLFVLVLIHASQKCIFECGNVRTISRIRSRDYNLSTRCSRFCFRLPHSIR